LLDIPNDRSTHTRPTPRGGGLGFLIAFLLTAMVSMVGHTAFPQQFGALSPNPLSVAAALLPLAIVGFVDDRYNLSARIRYAVQLGSAAIALICFGLLPQSWWPLTPIVVMLSTVATLIGFTALVNFYNFMDGLDGLVASVSALQLIFLALYLQQSLWWLLAAAILGFLWWNWSPAKIFMGDVGSTVLGASVAIALLEPTVEPLHQLSALAITLPLTADAIYTLMRRSIRGENIFQAHRTHLYQRLQQSGWSHASVAIAYLGWTLLIAGLLAIWSEWGSVVACMMSIVFVAGGEGYLHLSPQSVEKSS
ncbi:MAG: glycosyltransferase family 4 protein, partial [Leptolyngbyaceae cyanobacterium]